MDTMKAEAKKRNTKHDFAAQLMQLTFSKRRQKIISTPQTVADILSQLFCSCELFRLLPSGHCFNLVHILFS